MKIAFHSYKGGVGRTKVMVGLGMLLAKNGHRVGLVDFDLDASGLVTMFGHTKEDFDEENELLHILDKTDRAKITGSMLDVDHLVKQAFDGKELQKPGRLRYLPTVTNPKLSDHIVLDNISLFLEDLLQTVESDCGVDIVLTDLKPGYSPSFKSIIPYVEQTVVVTRIDRQNINGLGSLSERLKQPIVVANMVPEHNLTEQRLKDIEQECGYKVAVQMEYDAELFFDDDFTCIAKGNSSFRKGLEGLVKSLGIGGPKEPDEENE